MAVIPYFVLGLVAILVFILNAVAQLRTAAKRECELLGALLARRREVAGTTLEKTPSTLTSALAIDAGLSLTEASDRQELFDNLAEAVARQKETARAAVLKYNAVAAKPFFRLIGFRLKEEF